MVKRCANCPREANSASGAKLCDVDPPSRDVRRDEHVETARTKSRSTEPRSTRSANRSGQAMRTSALPAKSARPEAAEPRQPPLPAVRTPRRPALHEPLDDWAPKAEERAFAARP